MIKFFKSLISFPKLQKLELQGQWKGYYGYGEDYTEEDQNKRVEFMAAILSEGDQFHGTIQEDEQEGIPEVSRIEGEINDKYIYFIKTYSKSYFKDETGNLVIGDQPMTIEYTGAFRWSENKFTGDWVIKSKFLSNDGTVLDYESTGPWEMSKL